MSQDMQTRLVERRDALRTELVEGEERLARLEADVEALRSNLLRIRGAIQVLEEILAGGEVPPGLAGG